jgi:hypothetical protein
MSGGRHVVGDSFNHMVNPVGVPTIVRNKGEDILVNGYRFYAISPSQYNLEKIFHHFSVNVFRENCRHLCFLLICIPVFALVILLLSPEPRLSFILLLIPVALLTSAGGLCSYSFIKAARESMRKGFMLMLDWKGPEGIKEEAGITDTVLYGFPGYISAPGSCGIEYAYTFINETYVYVAWMHMITKRWTVMRFTHEELCSAPGRPSSVLSLMFDHEYMAKYGKMVWISEHVRILEQCLYTSVPLQELELPVKRMFAIGEYGCG